MLNKKLLLLLLLLILMVIWFWSSNTKDNIVETESVSSNADLMESESEVEVSVMGEVEYFPGAKGYFARPEAEGNYPGIVMIHENRGLRPEIKEAAESLAKEGYLVLAVDLFGTTAEDQVGARALTAAFDQEMGIANMRAATEYLREQGAVKMASLGWCFGGRQSVELATSGEHLDATVVYYGGGVSTSTEVLQPISWPVLGIFGDEDQILPVATVLDFSNALSENGVENEIHIYPGVGHAFANPSGANYAPEATLDAWEKTLDFLKRHLGS